MKLATSGNASWTEIASVEPKIGPDVRFVVRGRWLEGDEREPNGPLAQGLLVMNQLNLPFKLERLLALHVEADLLKKELIQDCMFMKGIRGGPDKLYSASQRVVIR